MKKYLLLITAVLGLFALVPTEAKAQDFSISVGPGYYEPGYYRGEYCDPGNGYYYYHRVYYRPSYYPGYYYGRYYHGRYYRHHRHHEYSEDDD